MRNMEGKNRALSPPAQLDRNMSSVDTAYEIECAFSPPLFKSPRDKGSEDYFTGPSWDSEHLRPRLLPSSAKEISAGQASPACAEFEKSRAATATTYDVEGDGDASA